MNQYIHAKIETTEWITVVYSSVFEKDRMISSCWLYNWESPYISLCYVSTTLSEQRKGHGYNMLRDLIDYCKNNKKETITLNVRKTNPAKALYDKLGFKVTQSDETSFYMCLFL